MWPRKPEFESPTGHDSLFFFLLTCCVVLCSPNPRYGHGVTLRNAAAATPAAAWCYKLNFRGPARCPPAACVYGMLTGNIVAARRRRHPPSPLFSHLAVRLSQRDHVRLAERNHAVATARGDATNSGYANKYRWMSKNHLKIVKSADSNSGGSSKWLRSRQQIDPSWGRSRTFFGPRSAVRSLWPNG